MNARPATHVDIPELVEGMTESGSKGKTSGALEAAADKVQNFFGGDDEADDHDEEDLEDDEVDEEEEDPEPEPVRPRRRQKQRERG